MRTLCAVLVLLVGFCAPSWAWTINSATSCTNFVSAVTDTCNVSIAAGHAVIINGSTAGSFSSATDSHSDTFTREYNSASSSGGRIAQFVFTNLPNAITTVSVTMGGGGAISIFEVFDISGMASTSPLDSAATVATGTSATVASTAPATITTGDLGIGNCTIGTGTAPTFSSVTSGYTSTNGGITTTAGGGISEWSVYNTNISSGATFSGVSNQGSNAYSCGIAAYKAAAPAGLVGFFIP